MPPIDCHATTGDTPWQIFLSQIPGYVAVQIVHEYQRYRNLFFGTSYRLERYQLDERIWRVLPAALSRLQIPPVDYISFCMEMADLPPWPATLLSDELVQLYKDTSGGIEQQRIREESSLRYDMDNLRVHKRSAASLRSLLVESAEVLSFGPLFVYVIAKLGKLEDVAKANFNGALLSLLSPARYEPYAVHFPDEIEALASEARHHWGDYASVMKSYQRAWEDQPPRGKP